MEQDVKEQEVEPKNGKPDGENKLVDLEKDELIDLLKRANAEAKNRRLTNQELEYELNKFKELERKKKEEEQKEQGKYEEIITELKGQLSEYEPKAKAFDEFKQSEIESAKEKLGDKWDDNWASLPLPSLKKIIDATSIEVVPSKVGTDNPLKGQKHTTVAELSEEEKAEAREWYPHLSEERAFELHKQTVLNRQKKKEK